MISLMTGRHLIGLSWNRGACVSLIQWLLIVTGTYCQAAFAVVCVCVGMNVALTASRNRKQGKL